MKSLGWALIQYDRCPYKKSTFGHSHMQREDNVKSQGEHLCLQAEEIPGATLPTRNHPSSNLDLGPLPQNCEKTHFCCWSHLTCSSPRALIFHIHYINNFCWSSIKILRKSNNLSPLLMPPPQSKSSLTRSSHWMVYLIGMPASTGRLLTGPRAYSQCRRQYLCLRMSNSMTVLLLTWLKAPRPRRPSKIQVCTSQHCVPLPQGKLY